MHVAFGWLQSFGRRANARCLALAVAASLAGCAGTTSVSDGLTTASLQQSGSGVAIMKARIVGTTCKDRAHLILALREGDHYEPVRKLNTHAVGWNNGDDVMQVALEAGTYHVVHLGCTQQVGRYVWRVGIGKRVGKGMFGMGGRWVRSFAKFTIAPGEIVDVGYLQATVASNGSGQLTVTSIPQASRARFQKRRPNLAARMTQRHMTIKRHTTDPNRMKKLCQALAKIFEAANGKAKLPPQCASYATNWN